MIGVCMSAPTMHLNRQLFDLHYLMHWLNIVLSIHNQLIKNCFSFELDNLCPLCNRYTIDETCINIFLCTGIIRKSEECLFQRLNESYRCLPLRCLAKERSTTSVFISLTFFIFVIIISSR